MSISPDALQAFAQAAATGSFSAAARRLGKSQSTLSEAIARLEIDLGVTLFERGARHLSLTPAGQHLLARAEAILVATDRLQQSAAQLASGLESKITLVLSDAYQPAQYEARLEELDQRYPDLEFECLIAEQADVLDLVRQGRADLGMLAARASYPPELGHGRCAAGGEFALFAASNHPLSQLNSVGLPDLAHWRILRLSTLVQSDTAVDDLPNEGGRCWSAPNYLLLLGMAVQGLGWAALPRALVQDFAHGQLRELPVLGWPRQVPVDLVWSRQRGLGPAGSWLLERLQSATNGSARTPGGL